jgi:hypothetical protein
MGVMLFVFGFYSLQSLMKASNESDDAYPRDPFAGGRVLSVLFAYLAILWFDAIAVRRAAGFRRWRGPLTIWKSIA